MPTTATPTMTAEEFLAFTDTAPDNCRYELVGGQIVDSPLYGRKQGVVAANLGRMLGEYARSSGLGYPALGVGLVVRRNPDTVRCPAVSFFEGSAKFDEIDDGFPTEPPTLAVEIEPLDNIEVCMTELLAAGVNVVWAIDLNERRVAVADRKDGLLAFNITSVLTHPRLPGFACKVADLFRIPEDRVEGEVKS